MPDSYLKKQYLFACFNITLFTKGSGVMWKTTTSRRVWHGPDMPSGVGRDWARSRWWCRGLRGRLVLRSHSSIPLDFFGLIPFFQRSYN